MNTPSLIRQQLAGLRSYVDGLVWRLLFFTRVSATSADGSADGVEGWPGTEGDPASPQQTVRRMEPWGVHGRPSPGIQALIARVLAGAASGLQVGIWTGKYGRQNLAEGETQIYSSASGAEVWLDKDGNVHVNAASGKDVIVNGGSAKVARVGDATAGHQHGGVTGPASAGAAHTHTITTDTDTINAGADHLKA